MLKNISFVCLLFVVTNTQAQKFMKVNNLSNRASVGKNIITVLNVGNSSNALFNDIEPYYIGNKNRKNGYQFSFEKPVRHILLHFTAINEDEKIEIDINGLKYQISSNNISSYMPELGAVSIAVDGILTSKSKRMTNATVDIAPGYDIHSLYVHHLNGLKSGCVFDLSFEDNGNFNGSNNDSGSVNNNYLETRSINVPKSLQLFPNPTSGSFFIKGFVNEEKELQLTIVNDVGEKIYEKHLTTSNQKIDEKIDLISTLPNGIYTLYINGGQKNTPIKFTLTR